MKTNDCPACNGKGYINVLDPGTAEEVMRDGSSVIVLKKTMRFLKEVDCSVCEGNRVITLEQLFEYRIKNEQN